jgi:hypothetical protein
MIRAPANLPFIVQAAGQFAPDQVKVSYEPTPRPTTPDLENSIAEIWEDQTASAKTDGRLLFNGEMLRYLRHHVAAGALAGRSTRDAASEAPGVPAALYHDSPQAGRSEGNPKSPSEAKIPCAPGQNPKFVLSVGPTCYRDFVGTNLFNRHRADEIGWEKFSNPIGTTGTILTADHQICYGRRSPKVAWHANHVHTFGGALEMNDRAADGTVDTFASLRRELHEELALTSDDIEQIICTGLIRDKEIHQPELLFDVQVRLTAAQIEQRWQTAESRDEHSAIVTLPDTPAAIASFVRDCGSIAPVAIGALHLHARRIFD